MSLSQLLGIDSIRKNSHPKCFYLKWTTDGPSDCPRYVASWVCFDDLDKSKIVWKESIKWKELGDDIILATDYQSAPYHSLVKNSYSNTAYLKSHLQKCIRRNNTSKALKTVYHLYNLDPSELLRRLCIIAIEDALPLQGFSTLVWLMAAHSKGFSLSVSHLGWILGYTYDLAQCKYYEQIDHSLVVKKGIKFSNLKLFKLNQDGRNLCYSIMLRQSFGGMRGDKNMCISAAFLWSVRYNTKSRFLSLLDRKQIFVSMPSNDLWKSEWLLAAIDFHCYPGILNYIWERHDKYDEDKIKSAIWHCSSSVTTKKNIAVDLKQRDWNNLEHLTIWKDIRKTFLSIGKFMVDKNA